MFQRLNEQYNFTAKNHNMDKEAIKKFLYERINEFDKNFGELSDKATENCFENIQTMHKDYPPEKCNQDSYNFYMCHVDDCERIQENLRK